MDVHICQTKCKNPLFKISNHLYNPNNQKLDLVFYVLFEVYDVNLNCNNLKKFPPMIFILFLMKKKRKNVHNNISVQKQQIKKL
jgi:hypothetical protein